MIKYWYHYLRVWLFRKKCKCPKEYQLIRAETEKTIYYICGICLRGWYEEKI